MFTDLIKAVHHTQENDQKAELDDERLKQLMDELFSSEDKGGALEKSSEKEAAEEEEEEGDALEKSSEKEAAEEEEGDALEKSSKEEEEEEGDALEKSSKRRELMDKVYSLVDNLSEAELKAIVESRPMRKAMALELFDRLESGDLEELVTKMQANGADIGKLEAVQTPVMSQSDESQEGATGADE